MLNLPRLAENLKLKQNRWAKEKRSGQESVRSVQWVSMMKSKVEKTWEKKCVLSLEWKREGVIDGDRGGDDSVDPTCVG